MSTYCARERQNVFVEPEEMEKHVLSPMYTEGIIGVLAFCPCDHEGRRKIGAVKSEKTTQVANA